MNKQSLHNWKSLLLHFWPSQLKVYANSIFLTLRKFGKPTQLTKHPSVIFLLSELRMYCVPLTWQEQESLGHEAHLAALSGALWFFARPGCKLGRNCHLFLGLTGRYGGSQNS